MEVTPAWLTEQLIKKGLDCQVNGYAGAWLADVEVEVVAGKLRDSQACCGGMLL